MNSSNGSQMATDRSPSKASQNASGGNFQLQRFYRANCSSARTDCVDGANRPPAAPLRHWTTVDPPADAGGRVDVFGNLIVTIFVALAVGMATYAIHQEGQIQPQERQALQQRR